VRRDRPCGRTAEKGDELAPLDIDCHETLPRDRANATEDDITL
jgi:hypothetical protein